MKRYLLFASQLYSYSILRPIQQAIRDRGDEVSWFLHNVDTKYIKSDEHLLPDIPSVLNYNPLAVISSNNWVPYFFPGIKVEVFHGFNAQKREDAIGHFRIRGWFDLYCTQGPSTTEIFQDLSRQLGYFHAMETGWPKLDPLFTPGAVPDFREQFSINKPIVLYTSTFSHNLTSAPIVYDTIKQLAESNKWFWFINLHPKMDKSIVHQYRALESDNVKFFETDNVLPLLKAADVMLSDTSSIVFEFLTQHKPVVTFRHRKPGPYLLNITSTADIESTISEALTRPRILIDAIKSFVNELHPYYDGKSSERVLDSIDYYLENIQGKLKRKPLNLGRKLMTRRKFHYYRFS